jgi:hypothetical protein
MVTHPKFANTAKLFASTDSCALYTRDGDGERFSFVLSAHN